MCVCGITAVYNRLANSAVSVRLCKAHCMAVAVDVSYKVGVGGGVCASALYICAICDYVGFRV